MHDKLFLIQRMASLCWSSKINHIMSTLNLRRIFIIAGAVSLFISYLGIWQRMISNPAERTGADFIHFYSAGRIAQLYGPDRVYNLTLQHDIEQEQVGFPLAPDQVLPYNHLPFLIPILQIIVGTDYVSSFYRWALIMILVYGLGLYLLTRLLRQGGTEPQSVRMATIGGLLFLPFFVSLLNGQDTAFLFLGAALWMYGLLSSRSMLAGGGLSLTTIRPHIALLLALPMLFHNRKVFLGFVIGTGILALVSFAILGVQGTREFINILLLSADGVLYGIKPEAMFNLIGLLTRIFPWLGEHTIRTIGWFVYCITIVGLCILWGRSRDFHDTQIGLTVILALFVAPHLYFHDLSLLLISIYELIWRSRENRGLRNSSVITLPIAISVLLLVSNLSPYLEYGTPYLIMLGLAVYPYYLTLRTPVTTPHRS